MQNIIYRDEKSYETVVCRPAKLEPLHCQYYSHECQLNPYHTPHYLEFTGGSDFVSGLYMPGLEYY